MKGYEILEYHENIARAGKVANRDLRQHAPGLWDHYSPKQWSSKNAQVLPLLSARRRIGGRFCYIAGVATCMKRFAFSRDFGVFLSHALVTVSLRCSQTELKKYGCRARWRSTLYAISETAKGWLRRNATNSNPAISMEESALVCKSRREHEAHRVPK